MTLGIYTRKNSIYPSIIKIPAAETEEEKGVPEAPLKTTK